MNRLTKSLALTCLLASTGLVGLAACGSDDDDNVAPVPDAGILDATKLDATGAPLDAGSTVINPSGDASDASAPLDDGQIYQILHEGNLGEISEANLALTSATTSAIQNIAAQFKTDHTMADSQLMAAANAGSIVPAESDASETEENMTSMDEQQYQSLMGETFDYAYLTNQIAVHSTLLMTINYRLLPQVQNAGLKTQVQAAQMMVSMHLTELQALQADGGIPESNSDGGSDAGDAAAAADAHGG